MTAFACMHVCLANGCDLHRNLSSNAIGGSLPANWGWNNVFTQLQVITLDDNRLTGSLPSGYSNSNAFKSLIVLNLDRNNLTGARKCFSRKALLDFAVLKEWTMQYWRSGRSPLAVLLPTDGVQAQENRQELWLCSSAGVITLGSIP